MNFSKSSVKKISKYLSSVSSSPLLFVETAFPWGKGSLKDAMGPQEWQKDVLKEIEYGIKNKIKPIRIAVASGHGIGKSALAAWLILWFLATCPDTKGVITANTEKQLKTKTWAELIKWLRISIISPIFTVTSSSIFLADKKYEKTWRADMVPWNTNNTEAFAGLHNKGGRIFIIFDEASAIPDKIWEVTEGAMTDSGSEIIWIVFGNPTRATGMFRECFGKFRHRWTHKQIDSRTSLITDKNQLKSWIEDYGIDSDFVKVRILGQFPDSSSNCFIPLNIAKKAAERTLTSKDVIDEPKVMGIDIARFGEDSSVIVKRQGHLCLKPERFKKMDTMTFAAIVADRIKTFAPDAIFADAGGVGGGVIDRLNQLGFDVIGVDFGGKPIDKYKYFNKRAEMWGLMRTWLNEWGNIPDDSDLILDITTPNYGFSGDKGQIILEKKESMKKRGMASPDSGDALALTFAYPVEKKNIFTSLPWYNESLNDLTITDL